MDKGMDIRNSIFIYKKQVKDTGKNMALLVQFVMFPMMAAIMENAIHLEDMPEHFFVGMFAVMHVGMAPLTVTVSIISEEKEKNTLRMLLLANVRPLEYLCGIGSFVFSACMAGGIPFGILGGYEGNPCINAVWRCDRHLEQEPGGSDFSVDAGHDDLRFPANACHV